MNETSLADLQKAQQGLQGLIHFLGAFAHIGPNGSGVYAVAPIVTAAAAAEARSINIEKPAVQKCPHCLEEGRPHAGQAPLCKIVHALVTQVGPTGCALAELAELATTGRVTPTHPDSHRVQKSINARQDAIAKRLRAKHNLYLHLVSKSLGQRADRLPAPAHIWSVSNTPQPEKKE